MALDFHRLDNREYLFSLNDKKYINLEEIFTDYKNWTGIEIDSFSNIKLFIENQKILLKIIDTYIEKSNLNVDKQKTIDILEFKALLNYFLNKNIDLEILGD